MSRDLKKLTIEMQNKASIVVDLCSKNGVDLLIYCTDRSLNEQARLYRQGRAYYKIKRKIEKLHSRDFSFLANIIKEVGPQTGKNIITYAGPGESWHNYHEAFDAVPIIQGKAAWNDRAAYEIYGEAVREAGLIWAGDWKNFKEFPHAQLRDGGNPLKVLSVEEIRKILIYKS